MHLGNFNNEQKITGPRMKRSGIEGLDFGRFRLCTNN